MGGGGAGGRVFILTFLTIVSDVREKLWFRNMNEVGLNGVISWGRRLAVLVT